MADQGRSQGSHPASLPLYDTLPPLGIAFCVVTGIIALLAVAATVTEYVAGPAALPDALAAFSVITNGKELFTLEAKDPLTTCLDGMRVL